MASDSPYSPASSAEDSLFTNDSESSDGSASSEHSEQHVSPVRSSTMPSGLTSTTSFEPLVDDDLDDEVQILTAVEAAAEVAAAAKKALTEPTRKRKRLLIETRPEPTECSICCEDCTLIGRHRLVALKCGHLFGKKCIERWIKEKHLCPNCHAFVCRTDIRLLFTDHVTVMDTSHLEAMTLKYQAEKVKNTNLAMEMATLRLELQLKINETNQLYTKLKTLKASVEKSPGVPESNTIDAKELIVLSQDPCEETRNEFETQRPLRRPVNVLTSQESPTSESTSSIVAVRQYKSLCVLPLVHARVFNIARSCQFVCVGDTIVPGSHGILLFSCQDLTRQPVRVPIHSSDVRDICIHSTEQFVLTVAFDGTIALTSLHDQNVACQIQLPSRVRQGWSCSLSEVDPYAMYCGFQDGRVVKFDSRKPRHGEQGIVQTFLLPTRQPVHSIRLFQTMDGQEGLAAATFRDLSVWQKVSHVATDGMQPFAHVKPSDSACYSLASNQLYPSQMVVSARSIPTKHSVFDLWCLGVHRLAPRVEFAGHQASSVLSRSAMWSEADGTSIVASWSQDVEKVTLWNPATHGEIKGPEPELSSVANAAMPVVDIQHAVAMNNWNSGTALYGTMTARQLCIYSR
ncbi:uncharacterized protein CCR75_004823 [Bremia lactucae]|uniref:RING-type E3 ubiquitin transferase n=1 Tax=Bremia lactucae TaxID=4779 RepID=A0A976ID04_BRELC|nr:hypothetical protein CCR75_004823 [Bremia lactucae]